MLFFVDKIYSDSLKHHYKLKGKLDIRSKSPLSSKRLLALNYTPGVAQACREIFSDPKKVFDLTIKRDTVAIVSDGSAVLGLGNIGALAAIPVMEGKAMIFKEFGGLNAFPICVKSQDPKEIVRTVREIAPVFGAINLEDIAAPHCFEVSEALQDLGIPVLHDDQHGTAVIVLAGLINASKILRKPFSELKVVISGVGAAGTAIAKLLLCIGIDKNICESVQSICLVDSKGIIYSGRPDLNEYKQELAGQTNPLRVKGNLSDALAGANVFIGVSKPDIVTEEMVRSMEKDPVIFAMANPEPEILPQKAFRAGAALVGTGRSDFPNQINNAVAFPGLFRGAIDAGATKFNSQMLIAAANTLAGTVKKPSKKIFIPTPFHKDVAKAVAKAVAKTAVKTGVTRHSV